MLSKIKNDLPSSIVVFLVALPLCLGIALASGAPLLSGIISGIIGGIIVGLFSGSQTSVSGPAAGLATIVLASIATLGGFDNFLSALLIAGFLQIAIGYLKGGMIAGYIPSNVIKGLLAAIGILLILKQIPRAVGYDTDHEHAFAFIQPNGENTFSHLFHSISNHTPGSIVISLISIFLLIFWDKTALKKVKLLPPSLVVVALSIGLNEIFRKYIPSLFIEGHHLVSIPPSNITELFKFKLPMLSSLANYNVWIVAFTLTVVASLETLLNIEAVDNIDAHKRRSPPNKELIAQGIGNILAGLLGGLPVTSVIVRSSVNIEAGARTKLSSILHGLFLLISILTITSVLNLIPLAALAVILIMTGYKLAKGKIFKEMFQKGWNQFIPFIATISGILFTDLLIGVLIGLAVSIFYILKSNYKNPFVLQKETLLKDEIVRIELPNQVSFLNKASIKDVLWDIPNNSKVIIDATYSDFIDSDILSLIDDFKNTVSKEKHIQLNILGLKDKYQLEDHIQFVNVLDKATQQKITPLEILEILKKGNNRFVNGERAEKYLKHQVNATSFGQNPFAIILSCIDSRTTTEHIFDLGLGDIFSIRIAGNILNEDILGSMEFGVHEVGVKLVIVLGHTKCGAIVGACNHVKLGNLTTLLNKVKPVIENEKTITQNRDGSNNIFVNKIAEQNVFYTVERIRKESTLIAELEQAGKLKIVGGLYDVETGKVVFYN